MSRTKTSGLAMSDQPRLPSVRDVSIFYEVRVAGRTQAEVAKQFDISQPRVSQIVKRLAPWRADVPPDQAGDLAAEQYRRLMHWQWRERTEMMFSDARADYLRSRGEHVTKKVGPRGEETTTRPPRADIRALEQCRRLNNDLLKRADQPPPPGAEPPIPWEVQTALAMLRRIESGEWTVDRADHEAVELQRATKTPIPRLWAKYDGDPVRDAETYEPITPRELDVPPVVRWSSGRFYVNEACYAVYVPRAGGRLREKLAAKLAQERGGMNMEGAAAAATLARSASEGELGDPAQATTLARSASEGELRDPARGDGVQAKRDETFSDERPASTSSPEHGQDARGTRPEILAQGHGGPEHGDVAHPRLRYGLVESASETTLARRASEGELRDPAWGDGVQANRDETFSDERPASTSSPEHGQDARGTPSDARSARYARVGMDFIVHPDVAAQIAKNRAEKVRKQLARARGTASKGSPEHGQDARGTRRKRLKSAKIPSAAGAVGREPEPGLNRPLTKASSVCGPPGAETASPAGFGGFRS